MSKPKFYSGPPPFPGWFLSRPVPCDGSCAGWRFFDGEMWSGQVDEGQSAKEAANVARWFRWLWHVHEIEWSEYYPRNARVPRVDPRKAQ